MEKPDYGGVGCGDPQALLNKDSQQKAQAARFWG